MNAAGAMRDCDALLVVPPFAGLDRPSLAAHLLQACARRAGLDVAVFYANMALAARIGERAYQAISYAPTGALLGERFFAAAAYGTPLFGRDAGSCDVFFLARRHEPLGTMTVAELCELAKDAGAWIEEIAEAVAGHRIAAAGCTTTFEQTAASLALLRALKQRRPDVVTLLGGANCEGEMASGLRGIAAGVDVIFSGESERTFPEVLASILRGEAAAAVVEGAPAFDLDALPPPDYTEYYAQLAGMLPEARFAAAGAVWLPYESSRGCWWGQKHHCTFCGLNAQTMAHREKSPDKVIAELRTLAAAHPTPNVCMADNIMPYRYFETLVPRLAAELPGIHLFYEQKANLSLRQVGQLADAGIREIQPGIEALSTHLLQLMDKGVTARQNIALLRYAQACDMKVNWNLLYAFPHDRVEDYTATTALVRRIMHLQPPSGLSRLSIDRFSPYFDRADRYGITDVQPMPSYAAVLPPGADVERIAYHFTASYATAGHDDTAWIAALDGEVERWLKLWTDDDAVTPTLAVAELGDDAFLLIDTRGLPGADEVQFLSEAETAVVLSGAPPAERQAVQWALDRELLVDLDGWLVPLATAPRDLLARFQAPRNERRAPCSAVA